MNKAEREFRLNEIRSERVSLERELHARGQKAAPQNRRSRMEMKKRRSQKKPSIWNSLRQAVKDPLGFNSLSSTASDLAEGGSGLLDAAVDAHWARWAMKRINELKEQEARLIGAADENDPYNIRQHLKR